MIDWSKWVWINQSKWISEWFKKVTGLSTDQWKSRGTSEWLNGSESVSESDSISAVVFRGGAFLTVIGRMCWPTRLWRWGRCSRLGSREVRAADIWVWTFPSVPTRRTPSVTGTNTSPPQVTHFSCTVLSACVRRVELVVDWMLALIDRWGSNQAHSGRWTAAVSDGQWHGRSVSHTAVPHLFFRGSVEP